MADTKISALPASTTPLAGTEVLPIVQSSTTRQVSVANLTAGRAISATQLTLTTGSLIVASGQGVDFSATPNTGTSELFNDYEEGTWTPAEATITLDAAIGHYTKVGNMVTAWAYMVWPITADVSNVVINGLPYATANSDDARSAFISYCDSASLLAGTGSVLPIKNSTQSVVYKTDGNRVTNAGMSQNNLRATWVYYT
jgi:hypothetical protein